MKISNLKVLVVASALVLSIAGCSKGTDDAQIPSGSYQMDFTDTQMAETVNSFYHDYLMCRSTDKTRTMQSCIAENTYAHTGLAADLQNNSLAKPGTDRVTCVTGLPERFVVNNVSAVSNNVGLAVVNIFKGSKTLTLRNAVVLEKDKPVVQHVGCPQ
jgi:hypothetical protein